MRRTGSRGGTEQVARKKRGATTGARLLLAGAGVAVVAMVAIPEGAAAQCPTGTRYSYWMSCQSTAPAPTWPGSSWSGWWPSPATAPPVTSPPATLPPATLPPVTLPAVSLPPVTPPAPVALPPLPLAPQSVPAAAQRLLELVNQERERLGLRALRLRDDVTAIALAHSTRMALDGDIFHNRAYFSRGTRRALNAAFRGENVAYNGSVESAHARLMRSGGHRANLLNPRFSVIGIAVVQAPDGRYFITENFLQPARPARRGILPAG